MWPTSSARRPEHRTDGQGLQKSEAEDDLGHENRQHEQRPQPARKLDAITVECIGGRQTNQERDESPKIAI